MATHKEHTLASEREPNRVLQLGIYTTAAIAGVVTASFKIWDEFYTKIKRSDLVKPLSDERYEAINAIAEKARSHSMSYKDYTKEVGKVERAYSENVNILLRDKIGIESEGFQGIIRGTLQRAETLGPYKRARIIFAGTAAVGTTLGAYFLINQNWRLKNELRDVHAQLNQSQNER